MRAFATRLALALLAGVASVPAHAQSSSYSLPQLTVDWAPEPATATIRVRADCNAPLVKSLDRAFRPHLVAHAREVRLDGLGRLGQETCNQWQEAALALEPGTYDVTLAGTTITSLTLRDTPVQQMAHLNDRMWRAQAEPAPEQYPKDSALRFTTQFSWTPATRQAVFEFSTGCLTSSMQNVRENLSVSVFPRENVIHIDGSWRGTMRGPIATADCGGARSRRILVDGLSPGTYTVFLNGDEIWTLVLGEDPVDKAEPRYQP